MAEIIPIGPGPESVAVALYAADPNGAKWDRAVWDGGTWAGLGWRDVGCDIGEATYRWGVSAEAGILSTAEAGELDLQTRDPDRSLDPLNTSSPYYGAVEPGTPVRITGVLAGALGALANGSFELSPPLTGWTAQVPALAEQSPITDAPDGAYTLRLVSDGVAVSPAVSQYIDVPPGLRVTLRAWARCAAGAEARMRVDGWDATAEVEHELFVRSTTAGAFAELAGTFSVPAGVTRLRVWLYIQGLVAAGLAVRFDAVTLTADPLTAWTGLIDEATYDLAAGTGRIRAIDGIAYLAQSQVPDGASLPNTLRARVRAVVALVGLGGLVPVEPEAATDPDVDPPVSPFAGKSSPAWQVISDAAQDALTYVWLDPAGTLRFRSFGAFPDASISIGCPDVTALGDVWLQGVSTLTATAAAGAIRNSVRAWSATDTFAPAVQDGPSLAKYGPRPLDVARLVPNRATWAGRILADRADAGIGVDVGEVRPYTPVELAAMLGTQVDGPAVIRVRDDSHGDMVDLDVSLLGAKVGITPAGWRFGLVTAISRVEWDAITPPPPIPPIPPPDPFHTETRTYIATSDALLALAGGGAKYGAGAADSLPVGTWQGWTYRACIALPSIPWTKVRAVKTATLKLRTSTQVRVGFGNSPTIEVRRITEAWSAGSSSSPSSGNAVVYPGPSTTSSGAVRANVSKNQQADIAIRIDAIARAWAPASIGGSGAAQRGVMLLPGSGSGADTAEVWPVEQGGAARPTLELVLEVFD